MCFIYEGLVQGLLRQRPSNRTQRLQSVCSTCFHVLLCQCFQNKADRRGRRQENEILSRAETAVSMQVIATGRSDEPEERPKWLGYKPVALFFLWGAGRQEAPRDPRAPALCSDCSSDSLRLSPTLSLSLLLSFSLSLICFVVFIVIEFAMCLFCVPLLLISPFCCYFLCR